MPDQVDSDVVRDDLVDEGRVVDGPAGLWLAEDVLELALSGRVLPRLPDVCRRLCVDVVGELVLELLSQRLLPQVVVAQLDLRLGLLGRGIGRVECLLRLLGLLCILLGGLLGRIDPGGGPGEVVCVAEGRGGRGRVLRLEEEEEGEAGERKHEGLLEGEHGGQALARWRRGRGAGRGMRRARAQVARRQ